MELYDEDDLKKEQKGKKIVKILLIISVICFLTIGSLIMLLPKSQIRKTVLFIDSGEKPITIPTGLFYTSENEKTYVDISAFANLIGYEYFRGEYNNPYTEDTSRCYVQGTEQATSFILGSDIAYKTDIENNLKYEQYQLEEPVISVNNKLYASMDSINLAFNSIVVQNNENNSINIYTLPYLYSFYEKKGYKLSYIEVVQKENSRETEEIEKEQSFNNQKTLVYGMAVVNKNNKFGVISTSTGNTIIGTKYDSIEFVEEKQEFIVKSGKKVGLLSNKGTTKIEPKYNSIELLDGKSNYFLVSENSKFGIVNDEDEIVIPIELDKISYEIINNKKMYKLQKGTEMLSIDQYLENK